MRKLIIVSTFGLIASLGMASAQNVNQWEHRAEMQSLMNEANFDEARAKALIDERKAFQLEQMRQRHQNIQQSGQNNPAWNTQRWNNQGGQQGQFNRNVGQKRGGNGMGRGMSRSGGNRGDCPRF